MINIFKHLQNRRLAQRYLVFRVLVNAYPDWIHSSALNSPKGLNRIRVNFILNNLNNCKHLEQRWEFELDTNAKTGKPFNRPMHMIRLNSSGYQAVLEELA